MAVACSVFPPGRPRPHFFPSWLRVVVVYGDPSMRATSSFSNSPYRREVRCTLLRQGVHCYLCSTRGRQVDPRARNSFLFSSPLPFYSPLPRTLAQAEGERPFSLSSSVGILFHCIADLPPLTWSMARPPTSAHAAVSASSAPSGDRAVAVSVPEVITLSTYGPDVDLRGPPPPTRGRQGRDKRVSAAPARFTESGTTGVAKLGASMRAQCSISRKPRAPEGFRHVAEAQSRE